MLYRPAVKPVALICRWSGRLGIYLSGLLALLIVAPTAQAQYRFDSWTTANGLPSNSVWALLQTRDGYLWAATSAGLVRFDGARLTIFDKGSTPGLTGTRFSVLHEDREGNLWAGTEDGALLRYRDGVFTGWTMRDGLPGTRIDRIDEDPAGVIWVFTDQGVAQWHEGRLTRVEPLAGTTLKNLVTSGGSSSDRYRTGIWQRNEEGWQVFRNGAWMQLPLPPSVNSQALGRLPYMNVDTRGRLWYGLPERPGEHYCVDEGQLQVFRTSPDQQAVLYQDRQGRLWTLSSVDRVSLWQDGKATPLLRQWVNFNQCVLEDREGNIWLGTYDAGLLRMTKQVISFIQLPGGPRERYVYPLLEDHAGNVWISAGEAGLLRYTNGRFTRFLLDRSKAAKDLSSLYQDRDGSIWVGTFDQEIARLRAGVLQTDQTLSAQIKGRVDVIHRDRAGHLWFGGRAGLHRMSDGQLRHYGPAEGLASAHVKALLEDSAGRLWVGGYGGVSLWQDGKFVNWTEADGMVSNRVISLHEDRNRSLWVGTYDGGLYRLRETAASWKLTRYTTREGLFTNQVSQILEDDQGCFWIGSARGIYRLRRQELDDFAEGRVSSITSTHFGKADGMLNIDCLGGFQPAGFKARDGRLWFPTQDGIAVIDPRRIPFNPTAPPVVIEECLLDRQAVPFRQGLRINPGQQNLEISYTALSFIKAEQMRFKYKLEGYDQDWVDVGTRRTAYYSHVPAGDYVFKVIAANSDGVWNEEGQSLRVTVLPPFYKTWWFLTLAALGIGTTLGLTVRYRIKQLHQRHEQQQAFARQLIASQESERKRIAAELHDSLGQHLLIIKNRAVLGERVAQDHTPAREQFDEITLSATQAIGEVRQIAYNLRPLNLDRLGLTAALEEMVEKVAAASGVEFSADIEPLDGLLAPEGQINLYRVVQESVNNIVRHAAATKANVEIWREDGHLHVTVRDNGRGLNTETPARRGLGLTSIAERVRILGGAQTINSAPDQGTTINISIPVAQTDGSVNGAGK